MRGGSVWGLAQCSELSVVVERTKTSCTHVWISTRQTCGHEVHEVSLTCFSLRHLDIDPPHVTLRLLVRRHKQLFTHLQVNQGEQVKASKKHAISRHTCIQHTFSASLESGLLALLDLLLHKMTCASTASLLVISLAQHRTKLSARLESD